MSVKYTKEELFKMPAIEIYKLISRKSIDGFPKSFWKQSGAEKNAILCVKYLIEEILSWTDEDIKEKLSVKPFKENNLSGMLQSVFNNSPYDAINSLYPNKFKQWEFKSAPKNFWILENGIKATKWLIEEKLKWTEKDIKEKLSVKTFSENKLNGMLITVFNNSPYNAINAAYPDKFKEWELKQVPHNFWTLENGIEAIKWLIEEELKWTEEDIKEKLSQELFKDSDLRPMFRCMFHGSPYKAINAVYPNRFKQWELKSVPQGFWTLENGAKATKWLFEEKLKWNDEDIMEQLSSETFKKNNLGGMLQLAFYNSPYKAINAAYPNRFKREDLKSYKRHLQKK